MPSWLECDCFFSQPINTWPQFLEKWCAQTSWASAHTWLIAQRGRPYLSYNGITTQGLSILFATSESAGTCLLHLWRPSPLPHSFRCIIHMLSSGVFHLFFNSHFFSYHHGCSHRLSVSSPAMMLMFSRQPTTTVTTWWLTMRTTGDDYTRMTLMTTEKEGWTKWTGEDAWD